MNIHASTIEASDDPLQLGTDPIPAAYYYDPDWFELERKAVFMRSWLNIGHVCELPEPGSFFRREIEFAGASLLVVRGKDGEIRAFHNVCTHRGTKLTSEDCGRKASFTCPYHAWTFGSDGNLLSAPDFERFYASKDELSLKQVAVDVCGGLLFICFDPQQSLPDYLGIFADRLEQVATAQATTFHEYAYEIDANWKVTYDNFQENYHLRFIHPNTSKAATSGDDPFGYPLSVTFSGRHRMQVLGDPDVNLLTPMTMVSGGRMMPNLMASGLLELPDPRDYLALFPSFFMLCNPGSNFLHTVMPISATRSRGVVRIYWKGDSDGASTLFGREYTMAVNRDVHTEDLGVIQLCQQGLSSGALEHVHLQEKEVMLRHLIEVVKEDVAAYQAEVEAGA